MGEGSWFWLLSRLPDPGQLCPLPELAAAPSSRHPGSQLAHSEGGQEDSAGQLPPPPSSSKYQGLLFSCTLRHPSSGRQRRGAVPTLSLGHTGLVHPLGGTVRAFFANRQL